MTSHNEIKTTRPLRRSAVLLPAILRQSNDKSSVFLPVSRVRSLSRPPSILQAIEEPLWIPQNADLAVLARPSTPTALATINAQFLRQDIVRFSSRIARSEALPSSLYLTNDRRTALDSAERRSGGFSAPSTPTPLATVNALSSDIRATNRPFFFPYRAFGDSPILPQACKPEQSSFGFRGSTIWRLRYRSRPLPRRPCSRADMSAVHGSPPADRERDNNAGPWTVDYGGGRHRRAASSGALWMGIGR